MELDKQALDRWITTEPEPEPDEQDIWQMLEAAPDYCTDTADLYHWSTNYDAGKGPFTLFLDLIGWSEDQIGEVFYSMTSASLGYLELDKLADALKEYSNRPTDVRAWVDELMEKESEQ